MLFGRSSGGLFSPGCIYFFEDLIPTLWVIPGVIVFRKNIHPSAGRTQRILRYVLVYHTSQCTQHARMSPHCNKNVCTLYSRLSVYVLSTLLVLILILVNTVDPEIVHRNRKRSLLSQSTVREDFVREKVPGSC